MEVPLPLNLNMCPNEGFILDKKRKKRETNDPNPKHFWSVLEEVNNTVQTYNRLNEMIPSQQQLQMSQPLQDITNSQMMRKTSLHQSEISPYYKDLYARKFIQRTDSGIAGLKRRHLETEIYMSQNREELDSSLYPEELFPKKVSKLTEMQTFHPAVNAVIDFKPNSALSAGTNVFLSGYWKKGLVTNIENDDSKGKVYTIKGA
ncbi:uncharacterized protein LOC134696595 isoform X1 [Mytilus trossulus]|uniref:uncharacterized protein LOC134696595 isoform X1 n=1 Tax=Mytilus trossulus TaxID=6551 RepID=UPI003007EAD9